MLTKPDFSGEYTLDRQSSTLSATAAAIDSGVVRIAHRDPIFRYAAKFGADGKTVLDFAFELIADGPEVALAENDSSRLYWDGDALVSEHRTATPVMFMLSWRYELADGGRLLRANERVRASGQEQDNVWIFARQ